MKVAVVQMCSGVERDRNLADAWRLIAQAADGGAEVVLLPENFALMARLDEDRLAIAEADGSGPIQRILRDAAATHGVWLAAGTYPARADCPDRVRARLALYNPAGEEVGHYDKLHLFDVDLPDGRESYRESCGIMPGDAVVTLRAGEAVLGCSICYDLRFPELYRQLVARGATLLLVPAAFTATTGAAHWHTLLRARAIENQCFVLAADQGGAHDNGRVTYGHSLIYGPWGECLVEAGTEPAVLHATLDLAALHSLRERFPVLDHRRIALANTTSAPAVLPLARGGIDPAVRAAPCDAAVADGTASSATQ